VLATVQFRIFCLPLSSIKQIKIYKTVILPVILYEFETWSVTLMKERRVTEYENRMLRRIFGPKWEEGRKVGMAGDAEDSIMRSFITCTLHKILLG
jgi:hypothetical protein